MSFVEFEIGPDQHVLRRSVQEFAEAEIRPHVLEWDEAQRFPIELIPALSQLGLMGIEIAEAYGGAGMTKLDQCVCVEELARVCPAVVLSVSAHINRFGADAERRQFLPVLARGEHIGAWAFTETSSGSDASRIQTTARSPTDAPRRRHREGLMRCRRPRPARRTARDAARRRLKTARHDHARMSHRGNPSSV